MFDWTYAADSPDGAAAIVFSCDEDGQQDEQICLVPVYGGDADRAQRQAEFLTGALNAYAETPEGKRAFEAL